MLSDSANYDRTMKRSTRVLSKFNEEQRKSAFESIKSSMIVVAGAQLIYKGMSSILGKLQASINKFTYAPLMEGLNEYSTQLENFQAIVQNTSQWFDSGDSVGQIEAITGALDELNAYADKTIYKYSDMMNAVKGFTTAGLTIEDSTSVAQGLASLTAYMGEGAQSYASAAYMFNQAMQQGKMQNYQWRSIEQTAGIGGEKTKKLMIETAKAMGKDAPDWDELANIYSSLGGEEADNTFRDSLRDDWLTADVLLESMKILNGEFDDATLKAKGFSDEIIKMSHDAFEAAGQVRTYGQFMDAVVESIGTGWSQIFRALFGDVSVATKMWTNLMNTVTDDIKVATDLISDEAKIFSDLGGRNNIEKILENIWKIIKNLGKSAYKVFGTMIPDGLGQTMYNLSESLVRITDVLAGNVEPASGFERIMVGIGDAVSFLFGLARRLAAVIVKLVKATKPIWDGVANFVSRFGPQLGKLLENIVGYIETLGDKLASSGLFEAIGGLFTGASDAIDSGLVKGVSGFFITIFDSIGNAIKGIDVDGIFGALINLIKSFTGMFDESADNTKSVWSFIKFAAAIWLAVKMLKPVFKDIASIAKSYKGVGNQFFPIMGAVLAVLIAFEMFNQIKIGNIFSIWFKMQFLSAAISLLARAITKISVAAGDAGTLIPLLLFIGGMVAAIVYGLLQAQKAGSDLDQLIEVLRVISSVLKAIAFIIGAIALLLFAISLKQFVAAKYGKNALEAAKKNQDILQTLLSKDTFNINTKSSISVDFLRKNVQYMLGISAVILSLGASIKMISDSIIAMGSMNPNAIWNGIKALLVISGILAILVSIITIFANLQSPKTKEFSTSMKGFKQLGKNKGKNKNNSSISGKSSESKGLGGIIASIIVVTAAIASLSYVAAKLSEIPPKKIWPAVGVIAVLAGIVAALVAALQLLSKIKTEGFKPGVIISLAIVLGAIVQLALVAALLSLIPGEKLVAGVGAVAILAVLVGGLMTGLQFLAKVKDVQGFKPSVILSLGVIIAGIVSLGLTAALLGLIPWPVLVQGGIAVAVLGGLMIAMTALIKKVGKDMDPNAVLSFLVATAGMTAVLIAFAAVAVALAALAAIPNVSKASPAILAIAGTVFILAASVAVLSTLVKQNIEGIIIGTLAMVALIAALSLVFDSLSKINTNIDSKLLQDVGNLMMLLTILVIALAAIVLASGGIGAAALLAAVAVILALAGAIALVMDALNKAADPLEAMVDLFELINEINMGKFLANLAVFVDALKKAIPTFASFSAAMGTFSGALLFSAGDMNITTQTITSGTVIPSSGTGGATEINTNTATVEAQQGSEIKQETSAEETAATGESAQEKKAAAVAQAKAEEEAREAEIEGYFKQIMAGTDNWDPNNLTDTQKEAIRRADRHLKQRTYDFFTPPRGKIKASEKRAELKTYYPSAFASDMENLIGSMTDMTGTLGDVESYMAIDASQIQIRDYRDVLSDVALPQGMTMNDAVETLNEIAESWRNGGLTTKADVMNEIHVQLNVDGEKLAEITDRVLGKNYAD